MKFMRWLRIFIPALLAIGSLEAGTRDFLKKPDTWFASDEAKTVAANILSYQSGYGGWPKNLDLTAAALRRTSDRAGGELKPIFDNGATTDEVRFHGEDVSRDEGRALSPRGRERRRLHPHRAIPDRRLAAVLSAGHALPPAHHLQ